MSYEPLTMGARPTNPNADFYSARRAQDQLMDLFNQGGMGQGRGQDMQILEMLAKQKGEQFTQMDDAGVFGGIRNSPRNPGGAQNSGLDWLQANYNPGNNPFEGRDVRSEAMAAVEAQRQQQQTQRQQEAIQLALSGQLNQDIGGANMTSFYDQNSRGAAGAAYGLNNPLPQPSMNVLNIPEQYGGGLGMGGGSRRSLDPNSMLPTGGYSKPLGLGGSGVPMSSGEAYSTDSLGNGIYADRDRSNPSSQDANMARRGADQSRIKGSVAQFFSQPPQQIVAQLEKQGMPLEVALDEAVNSGQLQPDQAQQIEMEAKAVVGRTPTPSVRPQRQQQQQINQDLRKMGQGSSLPGVTRNPGLLDTIGTGVASAIPYAAKPAEWALDLLFGANSSQGDMVQGGANLAKNDLLDWLYANLSR